MDSNKDSGDDSDDETLLNIKENIEKLKESENIIDTNKTKRKTRKKKYSTFKNRSNKISHRNALEAKVSQLKNTLEVAENNLDDLQKAVDKLYETYGNVLNPDQIAFISHKSCNKWSAPTIVKSFKLFAACGPSGYSEIKRLSLPYPSIKTLETIVNNIP